MTPTARRAPYAPRRNAPGAATAGGTATEKQLALLDQLAAEAGFAACERDARDCGPPRQRQPRDGKGEPEQLPTIPVTALQVAMEAHGHGRACSARPAKLKRDAAHRLICQLRGLKAQTRHRR